jgi:hypothetical protein
MSREKGLQRRSFTLLIRMEQKIGKPMRMLPNTCKMRSGSFSLSIYTIICITRHFQSIYSSFEIKINLKSISLKNKIVNTRRQSPRSQKSCRRFTNKNIRRMQSLSSSHNNTITKRITNDSRSYSEVPQSYVGLAYIYIHIYSDVCFNKISRF